MAYYVHQKVTFAMKSCEYFDDNINHNGVNFDSGICISIEQIHGKECMTPQPSFILQISIFV